MDTFMVQEKIGANKKGRNSPQPAKASLLRTRIISPKRKRFERDFEDFKKKREVLAPIDDLDTKKERDLVQPAFDAVTKNVNESKNAKMHHNMKVQENIR